MKGSKARSAHLCRQGEIPVTACLLSACAISLYVLFLPLETSPDLATFLLLAFGLFAAIGADEFRPRLTGLDYVVIVAVLATTGLSSLLSVDPARSTRFFIYLCFNVGVLILAACVISGTAVRLLCACVGLVGVVHLFGLLWAVQIAGDLSPNTIVREAHLATLIAPNDALILALCLPFFAYSLYDRCAEKAWLPGLLVAGYVALSTYVSFRLQSKLSFLGLLVAGLFSLGAGRLLSLWDTADFRQRMALSAAGFTAVFILSGFAWYLGNQSTTRLSLWAQAATVVDTPAEILSGVGPNTFLYDPKLAESLFDRGDLVVPWVHNLYLEAFHDQGLPGLLVIVALTMIPIVRALRLNDPAMRVVLSAALFTFVVMALFEITLTRRFYFAFLMCMYGLTAAQARGEQS